VNFLKTLTCKNSSKEKTRRITYLESRVTSKHFLFDSLKQNSSFINQGFRVKSHFIPDKLTLERLKNLVEGCSKFLKILNPFRDKRMTLGVNVQKRFKRL